MWFQRNPPGAEPNLKKEAVKAGIDPSRLIFSPRFGLSDHLWYKGACDLFMDSPYFNGHTTVGDALWAGIPVLALPHTQFFQRVGVSAVLTAGIPELVAINHADYISIATHLGNNRRAHEALVARYRAGKRGSAYFDAARWIRDFEARARKMWDVFTHQERPMHLA